MGGWRWWRRRWRYWEEGDQQTVWKGVEEEGQEQEEEVVHGAGLAASWLPLHAAAWATSADNRRERGEREGERGGEGGKEGREGGKEGREGGKEGREGGREGREGERGETREE